ncbi:hypothetical protein [Phormidium sp. FACHB-1136]|jgi:hypothetical protein|uniref:hypothetical protein n=1 Tax=Phormidium sp. FACHB-1136 TaxID=2692848 RepID=UPI001684A194|nr:hypothetical protein [Phormidium sp. FACHB-1136]MBD2428419.1 hypothetical protein [Phormidium sp. FACHB-1136]
MNTPPPVPLDYRKETIETAPEGPIQNIYRVPLPWWQNRRYWAVGGLSLVALSGVAFALAQSGRVGNTGVYQSQNPGPNLDNVLSAAQDRLSGNYQDSRLVLEDVQRSVLENEAYRFRTEAERAVRRETDPCFGQQLICPLNRFQRDAQAQLDIAKTERDWRKANNALFRVNAVELARNLPSVPQDPPINLAVVAIENITQFHDRTHSLSQEVQAHEVRR